MVGAGSTGGVTSTCMVCQTRLRQVHRRLCWNWGCLQLGMPTACLCFGQGLRAAEVRQARHLEASQAGKPACNAVLSTASGPSVQASSIWGGRCKLACPAALLDPELCGTAPGFPRTLLLLYF